MVCVMLMMLGGHAIAADVQKVALVIGNSNYVQLNPLNNTANDARAIGQSLSEMGFETKLVVDVNESDLRKTIRQFASDSASKDIAVIFYAGHGVQIDGQNYILPTDYELPRTEAEAKIAGVNVDDLLTSMQAKVRIVFLDACRDSPPLARQLSRGTRSAAAAQGLAPIKSADVGGDSGVFIAFATAAGSVAQDGDGQHSPFTQALLDNMKNPVSIDDMFSLVTRQVAASTKNAQRPYKYASLESIVCLTSACGGNVSGTTPPAAHLAVVSSLAVDIRDPKWLWVAVGPDSERYYIAPASIKKAGARTLVDERIISPDSSHISDGKAAFDCKANEAQMYAGAAWQNNQKVVNSDFLSPPDTIKLQPFGKNSIFATLAAFVCGRVSLKSEFELGDAFSDAWTPVAIDGIGVTWSVLPASIKKSGNYIVASVKQDLANAQRNPGRPVREFSDVYPYIIQRVAVICGTGELRTYVSEGWTQEKIVSAKTASAIGDVHPLKLTPERVGAQIGSYLCSKMGKELVFQ